MCSNCNFHTKMILSVTLLLLGSLFLFCGCQKETTPASCTGFYFDTVIQITVYDDSDPSVLDGCLKLADKYEALFSVSIEGSDLWRINHSSSSPVAVSEETAVLVETALRYAELTDGRIDPTIFPVSSLWSFGEEKTSPRIPAKETLEEALTHVDYHTISVSRCNGQCFVSLADPDAGLDLGFIAKGYIADRMKEYLLSEGVSSACINLGGNVLTLGSKPDHSPFRIGIQKPFAEDGTPITVVSLSDASLVSSGNYERYFYQGDVLYHHILDPSTGYPVSNSLTGVTILSESSMEGDALSTTCFCLGLEEGMKLIESLENIEAVFITKDYTLHYSSGFPQP